MDEARFLITGSYTPDKIKPQLMAFALMASGFVSLLPADAGKTIKNIFAILSGLIVQDWFAELLCYLLNSFEDGVLTKQEFTDALQYFANKVNK